MTGDVHEGRGGASALGRAYSTQVPGKGNMAAVSSRATRSYLHNPVLQN